MHISATGNNETTTVPLDALLIIQCTSTQYEEPSFIPFTKFIWILISCWGVHNVSTENDRNFTRNEIVLLDPKIILRTRSMYWNTAVTTTRIRGNFLLFFKRVIIEVLMRSCQATTSEHGLFFFLLFRAAPIFTVCVPRNENILNVDFVIMRGEF